LLLTQRQRLVQADLAIFVAVIADQQEGAGGDFIVDAGAALGGRRGVTLKTSRDYDSLLAC
jgi:hypothetical protein